MSVSFRQLLSLEVIGQRSDLQYGPEFPVCRASLARNWVESARRAEAKAELTNG